MTDPVSTSEPTTSYLDDVRPQLAAAIARAARGLGAELDVSTIRLDPPKQAEHGDYAANVALQIAKGLGKPPRVLATALSEALSADPELRDVVLAIEVAGPGFLNFKLNPLIRARVVHTILSEQAQFGCKPAVPGRQVMVEFVSANPTGPLHVGHGRQAALGDALAALLASQGASVHREFYYNDAGAQIDNLALSVQARARGLTPEDPSFPADGYRGEYITEIAQAFLAGASVEAADVAAVTASGNPDDLAGLRAFAVAWLRREQDLDLKAFGVAFDRYYLESSLYTEGRVERVVSALQTTGHAYEQDGALWLRTTDFGDDKDRVMRKREGGYTYFVPDVAYHVTKFERGFNQAINVQGSDHHGTIARVRAGLQALGVGIPQGYPDYVLHKMVTVMRGGEEVKISKRAGSYVTVRDLIDWVGRDAVRFFLISRRADSEFVFDVDLAVASTQDNPVYYVQYAHARICRMLAQHQVASATLASVDLSPLATPPANQVLKRLAAYPGVLANAAAELAPHAVAYYLRELAGDYHAYYNAERVLVDDEQVRAARLALCAAVAQVLRNGLGLLGVSAPEQM